MKPLTTREAAAIIGIATATLSRHASDGKIKAQKTPFGYLYEPDEVSAYAEMYASRHFARYADEYAAKQIADRLLDNRTTSATASKKFNFPLSEKSLMSARSPSDGRHPPVLDRGKERVLAHWRECGIDDPEYWFRVLLEDVEDSDE